MPLPYPTGTGKVERGTGTTFSPWSGANRALVTAGQVLLGTFVIPDGCKPTSHCFRSAMILSNAGGSPKRHFGMNSAPYCDGQACANALQNNSAIHFQRAVERVVGGALSKHLQVVSNLWRESLHGAKPTKPA